MEEREAEIPMICATGAIKTGPTRIGHIAGNITLPRTVALPTLALTLAGLLVGFIVMLAAPWGGLQATVIGTVFGGMFGYLLGTYSPLRGESMLTWLGLQANTLRRQRKVRGKPVTVAVGVGISDRDALGKFKLQRSAVRVPAGRYDERGVLISVRNRNVPDGAHVFGDHVYVSPGRTVPDPPSLSPFQPAQPSLPGPTEPIPPTSPATSPASSPASQPTQAPRALGDGPAPASPPAETAPVRPWPSLGGAPASPSPSSGSETASQQVQR